MRACFDYCFIMSAANGPKIELHIVVKCTITSIFMRDLTDIDSIRHLHLSEGFRTTKLFIGGLIIILHNDLQTPDLIIHML